jgi:hypothetical protein
VDFKARVKQIKPSTRCKRKKHSAHSEATRRSTSFDVVVIVVLKIGFVASLVSEFVLLAIFRINKFVFLSPRNFRVAGFDTLLLLIKRDGWHPPVCSVWSVTACYNLQMV